MEIKKQHILENASELFLENGYTKTSMQDVAESCNVSKATLYKFFTSKENLGLIVSIYLTEQMISKVEKITSKEEIPSKEILRQSIVARIERFGKRNRFMDEFLFSLPLNQREKYLPAINRCRFKIFELFSEIIMKAFEIECETMASELTINLNGLIKEITVVAGEDIIKLDEDLVADFIIDSLGAILEKRAEKKPLLTQEQLTALRAAFTDDEEAQELLFRKKRLLHSLKQTVEDYEKNGRSGSLQEAKSILEELNKIEESEEI